jgi:hypothetical protein
LTIVDFSQQLVTLPLSLDLECIAIIRDHALPILPRARPAFYEKVSELLRGVELGPGAVGRACVEAQRAFLVAPPAALEPTRQPPARSPLRR